MTVRLTAQSIEIIAVLNLMAYYAMRGQATRLMIAVFPSMTNITYTRSDYFDTSNPYRLMAFFKFCECANMARDGIAKLQIEDPRLQALTVSMMESTRQRAEQEAVNVLSGQSSFIAMVESNLSSDTQE